MQDEVNNKSKQQAKHKRDERLNAALRANLNKRKQQNRNREADQVDAGGDTGADAKASDVSDPPDVGER